MRYPSRGGPEWKLNASPSGDGGNRFQLCEDQGKQLARCIRRDGEDGAARSPLVPPAAKCADHACRSLEACREALAFVGVGPSGARVTGVQHRWEDMPPDSFADFEVRY